MRVRRLAVIAACAAFALAGCAGEQGEATESAAAPAATEAPSAPERPTADPDAPKGGVFADNDEMAHTMCELWTTKLNDPSDLRDVADDVSWYASQARNELLRGEPVSYDWGAGDPGYTNVVCKWNGYEAEEGSPADLLY